MVITFSEKVPSSAKKNSSDSTSAANSSSSGSGSAAVPLKSTYTTPEQERKLRSLSADGTSLAVSASKTAREALEKEISSQRSQYYEEDEQDQVLLQTSYMRGSPIRGQGRAGTSRSASTGGSASRYQPGAGRSGLGRNLQLTQAAVRNDPALLNTLQGLLGAENVQNVRSIEELEELMFMEV